MDHTKAVGLLHEGPLVGFTKQPVGAEQSEVNIGASLVRVIGKNWKENERKEYRKKLNNENTRKSSTKK